MFYRNMMAIKNLFLFSVTVAALVMSVAGCQDESNGHGCVAQATEVVPFSFTSIYDEKDDTNRIEIIQNGKVKFTYVAKHQGGFMQHIVASGCGVGYRRMVFEPINENTSYQDCLWDAKGDGDRRYITLGEWSGGNSRDSYQGYLIDVKDNFRVVKEIPIGEVCDYKIDNPNLVF